MVIDKALIIELWRDHQNLGLEAHHFAISNGGLVQGSAESTHCNWFVDYLILNFGFKYTM